MKPDSLPESGSLSTFDKEDRIHLEACQECKRRLAQYRTLELTMQESFLVPPPASITEFVMAKIMAKSPSMKSVMISIFVSLSAIVLLVFSYYGFAKDRLSRGASAFGNLLLNGLHSLVLFLSNLLDYCIVFAKTVNKLTHIVLGVGADIEMIGLMVLVMLTLLGFAFYKLLSKVIQPRET